jgi:hypothetical protein
VAIHAVRDQSSESDRNGSDHRSCGEPHVHVSPIRFSWRQDAYSSLRLRGRIQQEPKPETARADGPITNNESAVRAPDNLSMAAVALAISSGGALSSLETTALLQVDETSATLRKAAQVRYRSRGTPAGAPLRLRHGEPAAPRVQGLENEVVNHPWARRLDHSETRERVEGCVTRLHLTPWAVAARTR